MSPLCTARFGQHTDNGHFSGVMTRLHALFPSHEHHEDGAHSPAVQPGGHRRRKSRPAPKFIKVRMLTWNMHDSLPKVRMNCVYHHMNALQAKYTG